MFTINSRSLSALFLGLLLAGAMVAQAPPPLGTQLLVNTSFETAGLAGWSTVEGTVTTAAYGAVGLPGTNVSAAYAGGGYFARATSWSGNGIARLRQTFDVSGLASTINAGTLAVVLSGYFGGVGSDSDDAYLRARFFDVYGVEFPSYQIGPVSRTERNSETVLLCRQGIQTVPVQTVTVIIDVILSLYTGSSMEGLVDNLGFQLVNGAPAPPAMPLNTELLDNGGFTGTSITNPGTCNGWQVTEGVLAVVPYGGSSLPGATVSQAVAGGAYLAKGTSWSGNGVARMRQSFDLSGHAASIAAGTLAVRLSGYFGGVASDSDDVDLRARFFDAFGLELPAFQIGPVSAQARNHETTLVRREGTGVVPLQAARTVVEVTFRLYSGSSMEGLADNLSARLVTAGQTPLPLPTGSELLDDGGFAGLGVINPTISNGWTVTEGLFAVVPYGIPGMPPTNVSAAIGGGARLVQASTWSGNGVGRMRQTFNARGNAAAIDTYQMSLDLSGYFGGVGSDSDTARLNAYFIDAAGLQLGTTAYVGSVTPAERFNLTTLLYRPGSFAIPALTRTIIVELQMTLNSGSTIDGLADNLSARLVNVTSPLTRPGTQDLFFLLTGIGANPPTTGPGLDIKTIVANQILTVRLESTATGFHGAPLILALEAAPTGTLPITGIPGLQLNLAAIVILANSAAPGSPLPSPPLLPAGNNHSFAIPPGYAGTSLLFQALVLTPAAINSSYALSEAHEIRIL